MKLLVFTNPKAGRDDEYNEWYDTIHLKDLLEIPGVVAAERYRLRPTGIEGATEPKHRYLAIYELDGDLDAVMTELTTSSMVISDALDAENSVIAAYERI